MADAAGSVTLYGAGEEGLGPGRGLVTLGLALALDWAPGGGALAVRDSRGAVHTVARGARRGPHHRQDLPPTQVRGLDRTIYMIPTPSTVLPVLTTDCTALPSPVRATAPATPSPQPPRPSPSTLPSPWSSGTLRPPSSSSSLSGTSASSLERSSSSWLWAAWRTALCVADLDTATARPEGVMTGDSLWATSGREEARRSYQEEWRNS